MSLLVIPSKLPVPVHLRKFLRTTARFCSLFPALDELRDLLENPDNLTEMKFLLLEQKYLELLSQKNRIEALKVS